MILRKTCTKSGNILVLKNERGKGHHRHYKNEETKIDFKDHETLLNQFKEEIEELRGGE